MDRNEEITEKLIQYLDGELSDNERKAVEELLSADEAMQKELHNLQLAQEAVRAYGLKSQVASVRKQMLQAEAEAVSKSKVYPFALHLMKYAAILMFALLSVTIFMYASTSSARLYKENYQPYKVSVARGENPNNAIVNDFNTANYSQVIADFKATSSPNNRDYLLAAQAYQQTHKYGDAITLYNRLINPGNPDNSFRDDAEYYLGFTYLENHQSAKAKSIFEKIYTNPDHLYHDKVTFWMMLRLKILAIKDHGK